MGEDDVKMSVRIPEAAHTALKELARKDGRTLQGYVVRLLNAHVEKARKP